MGLLVGLAFVLVFGILISNHLSNVNEPTAAPLQSAADIVRSGLGQTGTDDVAPVLRAPAVVIPQQPIVTNEELNHHTAQPPVRFVQPQLPSQGQAITPAPPTGGGTVVDRLQQAAHRLGEEIVPAKSTGPVVDVTPPVDPQPKVDQPAVKPAVKTYVALTGDSLGAIALKEYGSSCRANREAIVAANPGLAANRDLIVAGRSYVIPPLGTAPSAAAPAPAPVAEKAPAAPSLTYVVKAHDTLWSIATSEVGTPSAVAAIEELNKDVLNGSDMVRPNMKLVLPAKKTE
jgi:nucleoid-associated protein YgaU